jgi:hypothetical protein
MLECLMAGGLMQRMLASVMLIASTVSVTAEPRLEWRVKNNFTLIANETTEARFASDLDQYLACMKQAFNPLACPNSQRPGIAERPYALRFTAKTLSYREAMLWPSSGEPIKDRVTLSASIKDAPDDATCTWSVDTEQLIVDGSCATDQLRVRLYDPDTEAGRSQVYNLTVTLKTGTAEQVFKEAIRVRRRIVVAMGDSLLSGEGNPLMWGRPTSGDDLASRDQWLEKRCHRSLVSAAGLAAWKLASDGKDLVAYFNVACSGSTAWHIPRTSKSYAGVESAQAARDEDAARHYTQPSMLAQIDEVKKAFCGVDRPCTVRPDVVILSVGINDLDFSSVVRRLTLSNSGTPPASMTAAVKLRLDRLGKDAATPGSLLHAYTNIETALAPRNTLVVEYPDPTKDDTGTYCNASPLFSGTGFFIIDTEENRWADDTLLKPLNAAVGKAVDSMRETRTTWRTVKGAVAATSQHGYCAARSHFNMGQDAKVDSGTLHPTVVGHDAIAGLVHAQIIEAFGR